MQCLKNINKTFTWSHINNYETKLRGLSIVPCEWKKALTWTGGWNTGKGLISPIFLSLHASCSVSR
jgi:hypothetical protein